MLEAAVARVVVPYSVHIELAVAVRIKMTEAVPGTSAVVKRNIVVCSVVEPSTDMAADTAVVKEQVHHLVAVDTELAAVAGAAVAVHALPAVARSAVVDNVADQGMRLH